MAFITVDYRRSANNIATYGVMALNFISLTPDGSFTTDDSENVLGFYIGVDVTVTAPASLTQNYVTPGAIGVYDARAIWRRLGSSDDRVYEFTFSDPVKWIITGAFIEVETIGTGHIYGRYGAIGEYSKKQIWGRLGMSRDRIYEISMSDPVKWVITSAFIEVE
jgi:hypothetical protein